MIVLPVLHLTTAKFFFGNTKIRRKCQSQSLAVKSYCIEYLLICPFFFFYSTATNNFRLLIGREVVMIAYCKL